MNGFCRTFANKAVPKIQICRVRKPANVWSHWEWVLHNFPKQVFKSVLEFKLQRQFQSVMSKGEVLAGWSWITNSWVDFTKNWPDGVGAQIQCSGERFWGRWILRICRSDRLSKRFRMRDEFQDRLGMFIRSENWRSGGFWRLELMEGLNLEMYDRMILPNKPLFPQLLCFWEYLSRC